MFVSGSFCGFLDGIRVGGVSFSVTSMPAKATAMNPQLKAFVIPGLVASSGLSLSSS